ncbi:uncharacterized protein LODBEIA_P15310 [Lodderomyces beijingensis]|uniref:Sodium/calcium exchanger membrane region domain-containing protein n=1 Tax=Lodderomyces beijingensis TaxID=1775926 RepID=A0ABP0ZM80_9ASCO
MKLAGLSSSSSSSLLLLLLSSAWALPVAEAIAAFDTKVDQCVLPTTTSPFSAKAACNYIESNCDVSYFKISQLYYCHHYSLSSLIFISSSIILALCLILLALSILVSNYLFRNLNELTTEFGLNNQILSFILIPLTNSFPDLINYFVILKSGSSNLVIGQLMGSLLIMFTIIIGLISILTGVFKVQHPKLLIIDLSWILVVLILFSYVLSDGKITQLECIIMTAVYLCYIVFLSIFDKEKMKTYDEELVICHDDHSHVVSQPYNIEDALSIITDVENRPGYGSVQSRSRSASPSPVLSPAITRSPSPLPTTLSSIDSKTQNSGLGLGLASASASASASESESDQTIPHLSVNYAPKIGGTTQTAPPMSRQCSYQQKALTAGATARITPKLVFTYTVQAVCNCIDFFLIFLIPFHRCIDNEDNPWKAKIRHSKVMTLWYFFEVPLLVNYQFFQIPLHILIPILVVSSPLALLGRKYCNYNSKLILVSTLGIVASLIVVSNISVYILQILKNLGIMWRISDYLLGMMVFAISNSINDIITNITLATKINPILGINSCLGTPLLIMLLGVGFNGFLVIKSNQGRSIKFDLKSSVILDTTALIFTIAFLLIFLPWNKWQLDKKLGICLIAWYFLITVINLYLE